MHNGEGGAPEQIPDDPKWETAVFGREVADFIDNDRIGQYLINRAQRDLAQAQERLLSVDPTDAKAIAAMQLDARVANRVRGWLAEAVQDGIDAEILIQQERDTHGG
jgi:hypothetical protein